MVDALRRAGRWVTAPHGCVIDLRPAHVEPDLELGLSDGSVLRVGGLVVEDERRVRHRAAAAAVREVAATGLFTIHDELTFPFFYYADSAEELRDHIAAHWKHTQMDPPTVARTADAMAANPGARLWLREQVGIRTLRPARPPR